MQPRPPRDVSPLGIKKPGKAPKILKGRLVSVLNSARKLGKTRNDRAGAGRVAEGDAAVPAPGDSPSVTIYTTGASRRCKSRERFLKTLNGNIKGRALLFKHSHKQTQCERHGVTMQYLFLPAKSSLHFKNQRFRHQDYRFIVFIFLRNISGLSAIKFCCVCDNHKKGVFFRYEKMSIAQKN